MEGSIAAYDPSRLRAGPGAEITRGADRTTGGPTRIEEATQIASHAADRLVGTTIGVRDLADHRLGVRPVPAVGTNGNKEPSISGTANELHQQLRRLHGAIDTLESELQRLREL